MAGGFFYGHIAEGLAQPRIGTHTCPMGHIDSCLDTLRRLIASADMTGLPLAETAIEEYWAATPLRARKSGLLYIQQILHDCRNTVSRRSRDFADTVDAYIERKLVI
jgi:hypothetical protein